MQRKKQVIGGTVLLGLLVVFSGTALATPATGGAETAFAYDKLYLAPGNSADTITVFGSGSSRGVPAAAQVSFGLTTFAPQAGAAFATHRELLATITRCLGDEDISPHSISTLYFHIWPEYTYGDNISPGPELTGYQVNSTISVHLPDPQLVPLVIETAFAAGASRLETIRYLPSSDLKQQAMKAAVQDGLVQAQSVASALGRGVGKLVRVDQSTSPPYELWEEGYAAAASGLQPEELEINRYLRLVFRLD